MPILSLYFFDRPSHQIGPNDVIITKTHQITEILNFNPRGSLRNAFMIRLSIHAVLCPEVVGFGVSITPQHYDVLTGDRPKGILL